MVRMRWSLVVLAVGCLGAAGCWYQRPDLEARYEVILVGMDEYDVVEELGEPTAVIENEMFYLYDDPDDPVRFRFVLDENGVVITRYFERKSDLAKRAEEVKGEFPPVELLPGDEEGRPYPGAPLPRFEKKP
jgi:hypothetical protein